MAAQYILTLEKLSKAYGKKEVLKNIWLSFYPGAKIGVIGGNGSGKSTLLKIMAQIDTDYIGTARPAAGITIGYLSQEPMLDPTLDVRGNVEIAVAPLRPISPGSTRSIPGWARGQTTMRWTSCSMSKPKFRTRSRRHRGGTSIVALRSPWTP